MLFQGKVGHGFPPDSASERHPQGRDEGAVVEGPCEYRSVDQCSDPNSEASLFLHLSAKSLLQGFPFLDSASGKIPIARVLRRMSRSAKKENATLPEYQGFHANSSSKAPTHTDPLIEESSLTLTERTGVRRRGKIGRGRALPVGSSPRVKGAA